MAVEEQLQKEGVDEFEREILKSELEYLNEQRRVLQ